MQLTRFRSGSVRELFAISFPLMMSSLSMVAMIFVDRVFLNHYNLAAMSAAVTAGTAAWALIGSLSILAGMAEVLVAQFHGSKRFRRLGEPVWQMIWFAAASLLLFLPLGLWGGSLLFLGSPIQELEEVYFRWLNIFGPIFVVQSALSGYFIGKGRPAIVTWLAIAGNLANVVLDIVFIFGVEGWIEPMGLKGAAIATGLGSVIQVVPLFILFLRRGEREKYGTGQYRFRWPVMRTCLSVGVAMAGMLFTELVGWTFFHRMLEMVGLKEIVIAGICQSIIILLMFVAEGVGRGASTIVGNYIGGGRPEEAFKVFRSGLKLHMIFFFIVSLIIFLSPQFFLDLFLGERAIQRAMESTGLAREEFLGLDAMLQTALHLILFFLLFEGVRYLISGMLTAAGDTLFILIAGTCSVVLFLLVPTYLFVYKLEQGVTVAYTIGVAFSFLISTVFLFRFYRGPWQKIDLLSDT